MPLILEFYHINNTLTSWINPRTYRSDPDPKPEDPLDARHSHGWELERPLFIIYHCIFEPPPRVVALAPDLTVNGEIFR